MAIVLLVPSVAIRDLDRLILKEHSPVPTERILVESDIRDRIAVAEGVVECCRQQHRVQEQAGRRKGASKLGTWTFQFFQPSPAGQTVRRNASLPPASIIV